ncbi:MAG: NAD(P)-dependent oxidoreductase [Candidatus Omnitrophica bacterium]|nr:NAD(P)-dependent oxidoreductase [Candidatus Omnitrophota bacterium]
MKILVTGANGFVGRVCVAEMLARGHEVDVLDLTDLGYFNGAGINSFYSCDITSPFTLSESFDAVVHLAAYNVTHIGDTAGPMYTRVNVDGTANLLSGVRTLRFVFLSTAKVYRKGAELITEEGEVDPQQPYEKTKRLAEELCLRMRNKEELVILRSVNAFGPGQPEKAVIPVFFARAINNEPIKVFGPRGAWLQFVYVYDLARALEMAAVTMEAEGIFNVAPDDAVRLEDLALMIKKICGSSSDICFTDEHLESRTKVSSNKIKERLGWRPSVALGEALNLYYEYYVKQHQA